MQLHLQGRSALVTAASEGLGFACAQALVDEGARVTISARRPQPLEAARVALDGPGRGVCAVTADLGLAPERDALWRAVETDMDTPDILVLSTGHPAAVGFDVATEDDWCHGQALLLDPVIDLARRALPSMRRRGYGRLVLIGSIFGREPSAASVVQSTYRAGLNGLAKCLAHDGAADGITTNVVIPGYFDTPLVHRLAADVGMQEGCDEADVLQRWRDYSPSRRFGRPEDLGAMVAFLASPRGAFVNGATIVMDGGALRSV